MAAASNAALVIAATRLLGVRDYGVYALAMTIYFFAVTLGRLGIEIALIRDVAQSRAEASRLLSSAWALSLPLALVTWAGLPALTAGLGYGDELRSLLTVLGLALVGHALARPAEAVVQGLERMPLLAAVRVTVDLATALGGVSLLLAGHGLAELVMLHAATAWLDAALLLAALRLGRHGASQGGWRPRRAIVLRLAREGLPLFVLSVLNLLLTRVDVLLLARIHDAEAVGLYAPGVSVVRFLETFRLSALATLYPFLAARYLEDPAELYQFYGRILKLFAAAALGAGLVLGYTAGGLYGIFYPAEHSEGASSLRILAAAMVFESVGAPLVTLVLITRRLAGFLWVAVGLVALNVVANLLLLPAWAHVGAAWATLLSALAGFVVPRWWMARHLGATLPTLRALFGRPILAAAVSVAVFLGLAPFAPWVAAAAAALAYGGAAFGLGFVKPADFGPFLQARSDEEGAA